MSKLALIGVLFVTGGFLILGFQGISSFMDQDYNWEDLAIVDVVDSEQLDWIDGISYQAIQNAADYVVAMPLYIILFIIGGILLLISGFIRK